MVAKKESDKKEALRALSLYCARRECCVSEAHEKLTKWELNEKEREWVIKQLQKNDFVNEKRYAQAYANDKLKFNLWGKIKIKQQLVAKGLPQKYIDLALKKIGIRNYNSILKELIKSQTKKYSATEDDKFLVKNRVAKYVISKGFEPDLVWRKLE